MTRTTDIPTDILTVTTTASTPTTTSADASDAPRTDPDQLRRVRRVLRRRHVATLATTSPAGRPHAAVVLYDAVDDVLWMSTMRTSRKGRNVAANPHVAVTVAFRRLPVGPPFALHFQAVAAVVERDDPELRRLAAAGSLPTVTAHGELDDPDGVFLRIAPLHTVHSYGLGVNLLDLVRDPMHAGARSVVLP